MWMLDQYKFKITMQIVNSNCRLQRDQRWSISRWQFKNKNVVCSIQCVAKNNDWLLFVWNRVVEDQMWNHCNENLDDDDRLRHWICWQDQFTDHIKEIQFYYNIMVDVFDDNSENASLRKCITEWENENDDDWILFLIDDDDDGDWEK